MTGNTYIDPGAVTKEAYEISRTSRGIARKFVGDSGPEDRIRQRASIAVGDFGMAELMRFSNDPVPAILAAIDRDAPILTDIRMVQVGIQKKGHDCPVLCALDYGEEIAISREITRTSAGFLALQDKIDGAIIVIGNAPSALITVCSMVQDGAARPAAIIGAPVGFVNAAESKELLRHVKIPSISTEGTRGGTPVAVAALNECITIHIEQGNEGSGH
ncbi:MAG: precorrin-8X methylmutase [Methanoregulaceae archaeon]